MSINENGSEHFKPITASSPGSMSFSFPDSNIIAKGSQPDRIDAIEFGPPFFNSTVLAAVSGSHFRIALKRRNPFSFSSKASLIFGCFSKNSESF